MAPESISVADPMPVASPPPEGQVTAASEPLVATSAEEQEGFHIVRAIVRGIVPTKRVVMRDAQSYCAILLDDNNRKPICRLRFNNTEKLRLGLFNDKKEEEIVSLETPDDIYEYADRIRAVVTAYASPTEA